MTVRTLCTLGAVLMILVMWAAPSFAGLTGDELLQECSGALSSGDPKDLEDSACMDYIAGFLDSYAVVTSSYPNAALFCLPKEGISDHQTIRIVVKWLEEHPEKLHLNAGKLITEALQDAFPCPKKEKDKKEWVEPFVK
ncbi:MAG: Rap1a/Tai family immunity protein [Desulfomonilia bacterium]